MDHDLTRDTFIAACNLGAGVRFVIRDGHFSIKQGKIHIESKRESEGFTLLENDGTWMRLSTELVLPESIEMLTIDPRLPDAAEFELLIRLERALMEKQYISLMAPTRHGSPSSLFEGWITGMEPACDGEYLICLNVDHPEGGERYVRLEKIEPGSFAVVQNRPVAVPSETLAGARVEAFTDLGVPAVVMPEWMVDFADFANPTVATGPELPAGLASLSPGHEIRFYFAEGELSIRLTVRRNMNGSWSFGDTSWDRKYVDEDFLNTVNDGKFGRYGVYEFLRLDSYPDTQHLPARDLRERLRGIRDKLLVERVTARYGSVFETWSGAIPENAHNADVCALILRAQDLEYDLARGFVAAIKPLTDSQCKTLAAIQYLIANDLTFWSNRVRPSRGSGGIYRKDSQKVTRPLEAVYNFEAHLYDAMGNYRLSYADGAWKKSPS